MVTFTQTIITKTLPPSGELTYLQQRGCTIRGTVSCQATFCFQHRNYCIKSQNKREPNIQTSIPLPSLRLRMDDAGDTGDSGTAFVWEVSPCSTSFFSADSILWGLSDSRGLLSPSGSVLTGRVLRSECDASFKRKTEQNTREKPRSQKGDKCREMEFNRLIFIPAHARPMR